LLPRLKRWLPSGLLWRLSFVNFIVIAGTIGVSSWAIYRTACFIAGGIGNFETLRQQQFNSTFLQYVLIFSVIGLALGSFVHFYLIKKILRPVRDLIEATKQLQKGEFPAPVKVDSEDEVGHLTEQFNRLISQLKMNEKERGKLINDISHEFRTPLSNLNGYLYALSEGHLKGDKDMYSSLYQEVNRLTHLIENMDKLKEWNHHADQGFLQKEFTNIKEQVNQSVSMFNYKLDQSNIPIIADIESKKLNINIEGIQQVLSNLLDNAIRYYEGHTPIYIEGEEIQKGYKISITGPGKMIDKRDIKHLFDRFYRVEESRNQETGGSGLGLAIAKEIVEKHNGNIGYSSSDSENTFWFVLPSL